MTDHDAQLKLQALLDGELPENEAAEVAAWLETAEGARQLEAELKNTRIAMIGAEMPAKIPVSVTREFYWSQIEREIRRQEAAPATAPAHHGWFARLRRYTMIPAIGAAALACLVAVITLRSGEPADEMGETEIASDDMGATSYRNDEDKVSMVWLYDRDAGPSAPDAASASGTPQ